MESPWSYAYAGRLDRLAEVVTATKTYSFSPGRGGICGNIDSGGEAGKVNDLVTPHIIVPAAMRLSLNLISGSFAKMGLHDQDGMCGRRWACTQSRGSQ
eukprot:COSAG02_NODE_35207_length_472_cov_0.689008_2_plen_99_part_00